MLCLFEDASATLEIEGRWLYPLFALHVARERLDAPLFAGVSAVSLTDPVIGRGAVFLYASLGVHRAQGRVVSERAFSAAAELGITLEAETVVSSIDCMTEELLQHVTDCEEALSALLERLSPTFTTMPRDFVSASVVSPSVASRAVMDFVAGR